LQYDDISYREASTYTGPSFNVGLPVSSVNGDPVDAVNNATGAPGSDGVQDFVFLPTQGERSSGVRNTVGADPNRRLRQRQPVPGHPGAHRAAASGDPVGRVEPVRAGHLVGRPAGHPSRRDALDPGDGEGIGVVHAAVRHPGGQRRRDRFPHLPAGQHVVHAGALHLFRELGAAPRSLLGRPRQRQEPRLAQSVALFQRVPNDLAVRAFSNEVGISTQDFTDRNLTTPRTGGSFTCDDGSGGSVACAISSAVLTQGTEPTNVVGGTKLPYEGRDSREGRVRMTPQSSLEVRAIFSESGRVLEDVQVNSRRGQIQTSNYGTGYGIPLTIRSEARRARRSASTLSAGRLRPYVLANRGLKNVRGRLFSLPEAQRDYRSLEVILHQAASRTTGRSMPTTACPSSTGLRGAVPQRQWAERSEHHLLVRLPELAPHVGASS